MKHSTAKMWDKLRLKEKRYETSQLMKEKRSEEKETLEEVFDKSTLMVVYRLLNRGVIKNIFGAVKSGKESKVYLAKDSKDRDLAVKIYLTGSSEFKKGMLPYIEGDPRFKHVKTSRHSLLEVWAQKEFKNLTSTRSAGLEVPKPIHVESNILIMEFIGANGVPAPLLREIKLSDPENIYSMIVTILRRLYQEASLVHADLSEYNVMIWRDRPIIFDMAQSVPVVHPLAEVYLRRDLNNLNNYFTRLGIDVIEIEELLGKVTASDAG